MGGIMSCIFKAIRLKMWLWIIFRAIEEAYVSTDSWHLYSWKSVGISWNINKMIMYNYSQHKKSIRMS
jgi:hypothetical protein